MTLVYLLIGGVIGFGIAWYIKTHEQKLEKDSFEAQKKALQDIDSRFKAVAGEVLSTHAKDFLALADQKEKSFDKIAKTVSESVDDAKAKIAKYETDRATQMGALGTSIKDILDTGTKMQQEARSLKTVLSAAGTSIRGRWGETVLRNLLEESGLTEGIDFHTQQTMEGEGGSLRPDIVINLPGSLKLAVDSKASLDEFIKAVEDQDELGKKSHIDAFVQGLRTTITKLSSKEYQKFLDAKVPYVVMFIPSEAAVRAAFENDTALYRDAQTKKVLISSPATIMPMILLIAHAWKQHKAVENASKIMQEIATLGERIKTFASHVAGIGSALSSSVKNFNSAAASWDLRVHPQIEKIATIGANLHTEISIPQIEEEPRAPEKILPSGR